MKIKESIILTAAIAALSSFNTAHSATLVSSSFVNTLDSGATVDTTGANVVDWGYLADGSPAMDGGGTDVFNTLTGANYASGGGAMSLTTSSISSRTTDRADHTFTFTDGNSPASGSGTDVPTGAAFGGWGSSEKGSVSFLFSDLGLGTHTITLYIGHYISSGDDTRVFDMDYSLLASDGNVTGTERSTDLGNTGTTTPTVNSVFQIEIANTVDAGADLSLTWDSVSGGSGEGFFSGYTVETVAIPEPSTTLLGVLGMLLLLRRRR